VTAHQVSQEPVRVVMGQKRNTRVNHVDLPSNAAPRPHDPRIQARKHKGRAGQ
jgi:hypothetical protein